MATNEPTLAVDGATGGSPARPVTESKTTAGPVFDEQRLGRSTSVFDAGVDLGMPGRPTPAPVVTPPVVVERPMTNRERRRRVALEARRVRRVIRHIEPWSVLKISVLFFFCLWMIFLLAGVLLWSFAESSGTLDSIEELVKSLFALDPEVDFWSGGTIFRVYMVATLVFAIAGVTFNVLLCVLYNLISDLTGGIRLTVIEEESARFKPPARRVRR